MSRLVGVQRDYYHVADDILAIEEEAVAARESEIRAAVEGMYDKREEAPWGPDEFWVDGEPYVRVFAVLTATDSSALDALRRRQNHSVTIPTRSRRTTPT